MSWRGAPAWTYGALCASFAAAFALGSRWNRRLVIAPIDGGIAAAQPRGEEIEAAAGATGSPRVWQKIDKGTGVRSAAYGFVDFKQDKITLSYKVPETEFKSYNDAYGYSAEQVTALQTWRDNATQSSYRLAVATHKTQAQVNAAAAAIQKEYAQKLHDYLQSRGFMLLPGGVTRVDVPGVVRQNKALVKPIAEVFERYADRHRYGSMDIIGAVLSFAQTAVKYKNVDPIYKGKHTLGFLLPITTIVLGWGDCDTKSAMVASILANWDQMRMVGISVPGHYLMGVLQIPDKGDMYVEYQGLQYILLEPAGPGWFPPGQVAEETVDQLNGSDGYQIYPFF
ncbi:MAG TPA: hypothetical protein VH309_13670 [Elusimicrobiota bacterium]|jgi:hypothetical protein|nr:hypothetical protein [Elusimicrobiota bacterium]